MNVERLQKIVDHLRFGKLGHKNFDYSCVNGGELTEANLCGTNGCAMGEFPFIFKNDWEFRLIPGLINFSVVRFVSDKELLGYYPYIYSNSVCKYLDIRESELEFLFFPWKSRLGEYATKEQVALHIEKFISFGGIYPEGYEISTFAENYNVKQEQLCTQNAY